MGRYMHRPKWSYRPLTPSRKWANPNALKISATQQIKSSTGKDSEHNFFWAVRPGQRGCYPRVFVNVAQSIFRGMASFWGLHDDLYRRFSCSCAFCVPIGICDWLRWMWMVVGGLYLHSAYVGCGWFAVDCAFTPNLDLLLVRL